MWWLPGWDSIPSTAWWSHFWFWFGIACLVALAASEVVSHVYSLRKDGLVAAAERAAEQQRRNDADAAEARHRTDVETVQRKLSEADKKVADLQTQQAPRRLSAAQQADLVRALSPFAGQKVRLRAVTNSDEPKNLAADFSRVFSGARWDYGNTVEYMMIAGPDPLGVQISVNPQDANDQASTTPALGVLVPALLSMGLMAAPKSRLTRERQ